MSRRHRLQTVVRKSYVIVGASPCAFRFSVLSVCRDHISLFTLCYSTCMRIHVTDLQFIIIDTRL